MNIALFQKRLPLAISLAVMLVACGVKGPPKALWAPKPLPMIEGLAYQTSEGMVTLTWRLPSPLAGKRAEQAHFVIRRSRSELGQPVCETCPRVFENAARVPYVATDGAEYAQGLPLASGYHYLFTVHLESGGEIGPDSEPLEFDFPVERP